MKTVFFDVDTQIDFMFPAGTLYVPGAELILPAVVRLNHWGASQGIPVISTMDAHSEDDPEFRVWPPHCVAGEFGQRKPQKTLLERQMVVPTSSGAAISVGKVQQILVEKQALDCFTNRNLPAVLEQLGADRYVVYGVVTEYCVRCAALGLQRMGARVEVVSDAIQGLRDEDSARAIDEFLTGGGVLTTTVAACS